MASLHYEDVTDAAARLKGYAVETPLIESHVLNKQAGRRVFLKLECLQRTGSFKFRGAFNRISKMTPAEMRAGVVAWSSGNHAQGVALAGQLRDVAVCVVMPRDAPAIKREKTRSYGAEIIEYDRYTEDREEIARAIAAERGAVLVPSYDDFDIMAGQGTCGLELVSQARALDVTLSDVLVCCGGGGLIAGCATAMKQDWPEARIFAVEPEGFEDHQRSLQSGQIEHNAPGAQSICDAILTPKPGALTFPVNKKLLDGGLVVSDDDVREAMRFAFSELKIVSEPGGAVALAAILTGKMGPGDTPIGAVVSGGNVDPDQFARIIAC
ncbi:MAG: threonine/serine dehydratase [Parvularculaceae bacterium]|nr:MAG: threonine/serine dehydratase [Parvularculaceae bacterium]